jgi:NAD(P)-dependent dehydrogenase (short-subunit alcohol dehydrogenase family)
MNGLVAVVTGGSSGIGRETALSLRRAGCTVFECSRRASDMEGIRHVSADVTDEKQVREAVARVLSEAGHIDILVCAAGFGISGAVEFTPLCDAQRQLDVNFFGMARTVQAVLPAMRQQGAGRIVCLSSVAAVLPIPFQTYYSVSKAAINGFVLALRSEVEPFGVSVCAVMPGDIRTAFTDARVKLHEGDDVYGGRIARSVAVMEKDERGGMDPAAAGAAIARLALKKRGKPLCSLGLKYQLFCVLAGLLPVSLRSFIVGKLYG